MTRRAVLAFLAAACGPLLIAFVAGGRWGVWTVALLGALFPVALAALGAVREERVPGRRGGPAGPLAALAVLLAGGGAAVLLTSGELSASDGMPWASRVMIVALWLLPLAISVTAYAATFGRSGVSDEDLEKVRRAARSGDAA